MQVFTCYYSNLCIERSWSATGRSNDAENNADDKTTTWIHKIYRILHINIARGDYVCMCGWFSSDSIVLLASARFHRMSYVTLDIASCRGCCCFSIILWSPFARYSMHDGSAPFRLNCIIRTPAAERVLVFMHTFVRARQWWYVRVYVASVIVMWPMHIVNIATFTESRQSSSAINNDNNRKK